MSDREELAACLYECGLHNYEKWLPEFEQLGILCKASLVRAEGSLNLLSQLEQKTEFELERKALQKLLKIVLQNDIVDFESFDKFLSQVLHNAKTTTTAGGDLICYETQIAKGITYLRTHYYQKYDDVLIFILMQSCYKTSGNTKRPLSIQQVASMRSLFFDKRKDFMKYKRMHAQQLQAYLFDLAISLNQKVHQDVLKELIQQIVRMMRFLQPPLHQELLKHVNEFIFGSSLKEFKKNMQYLMRSSPQASKQQISLSRNPNSLKNVLQKEMYPSDIFAQAQDQSCSFVNDHAQKLFETLQLSRYYPKGLQLQDALCIRPDILELSLGITSSNDVKRLPLLILHKIMCYNSLCRSDLMPKHQAGASVSDEDDDYEDSDNEDDLSGIHPVDNLLALILCSDDFLRQDLFSRLAKCQLAIPFLLPDPFTKQLTLPLWAFRAIIKEWKSTTETGAIIQQAQPIVTYKMPFISFIRFGTHQKRGASKSKILNEVINDSHYDHFFHRDCPGGQYKCILGEGLVDMCWYLPAGKPSDVFHDAVTFLNLHGDARQHPEQCKFLSKMSFMCFVLLTEEILELDSQTVEILNQFASSPGGVVLLNDVDQKPKAIKKEIPKAYVINLITKNGAEIKGAIQQRIRAKLYQATELQDIVYWCGKRERTILSDEDSDFYEEALAQAMEISSIIASHEAKSSTKELMLPLQGTKLWKSWATLDKELHRQIQRGKKTINDYTDSIHSEKKAIRIMQLDHIESLSSVMKSFIVSLLRLGGSFNKSVRNYFLQCLKLQLNNLSRKNISGLQYKYQSARKALSSLQTACDSQEDGSEVNTAEREELTKKLEEIQEGIINFSFGLEHLLRELGQVYEAALESSEFGGNLSYLPRAAAELLIDGYPLELMDGDAAHVPLQWVFAVLTEAIEILENPNVFVLSVLGLQSTGKSTMLNTAFGLQFNVSAGRCTRGAFMQLLPLDEKLKEQTKCSYVLVVDTEGLRAPELDPEKTQKHDNELATFVIGLANMTLINIYGEVPGDMDDILQTCVHAFIRMSQVKYNPSCQFIHQNAGANINSEVGRAKFTEKLNKFTIDAAKEENCEGQYKSFSDVIKFDDQTDVHCFPGLWKGDPPMAPINEGYSNASQMLKQHFINIMCKRSYSSILLSEEVSGNLSLSTFQLKVTNLWKNLLKENFVFSFKNTLEITAYNSLETAYGNWDWRFHEAMLNWEQRAENEIRTAEDDDVPRLVKEKCAQLQVYVFEELHEPLKLEMKEFFNGKQSEILVQWKARFENRLDDLAVELRLHAEKLCKELGRSRETISGFEKDKIKYAKLITDRVQRHIASLRQEQEKFDKSLEEKKFESEQLKKILERNLFSQKNLMVYKEASLLSDRQVSKIVHLIKFHDGQLTEKGLREILENEIISAEEMKSILMTTRQTEEELEDHFNVIWEEILSQLPVLSRDSETVEERVEAVLTEFVRAKRYEGQLIEKLQQTKLKEWGKQLDLFPEEGKHFVKSSNLLERGYQYLSRKVRGSNDPDQIQALEMTERVFNSASNYLREVEKKDSDFNPAFALELLHLVDKKRTEEAATAKKHFKFTTDYKLEVFLIVCGYAIPTFKKMADSFKKRNDPHVYLQQHVRGPLLTQYTNQYNQIKAEEGIAATVCKFLEAPLKEQIRRKLGAKMVGQMKNSGQHFSNKMALKVKILTDIHDEGGFSSYMGYVSNVKRCLQDRIRHYTVDYCDYQDLHGETRLQLAAKEEASRLISVVDNTVTRVKETTVKKWLLTFSKNMEFRRETGVSLDSDNILSGYDSLHKLNLKNFQSEIKDGLQNLESKLHFFFNDIQCEREMIHWKDKPHDLLEGLVGCTEQCPFCKEQCDLGEQHAGKHRTEVHRPSCLAGWRNSATHIMEADFCKSLIYSSATFQNSKTDNKPHPYRKYESVYPDWSIPPDPSCEGSLYWKSFVGEFNSQLADHYGAKPAEVSKWKGMSWRDVKKDLESVYKL